MKKKKKKVSKYKRIAKDLRAWLDSPEGKKAWEEATERARELHKKLEKALRPTHESLHRYLD